MGEVRSLHGGEIHTGEPNEDAIRCLEEILDRAKSGDVVGVQMVINYSDESTGWTFGGVHWGTRTIGACFSMLQDIERNINE